MERFEGVYYKGPEAGFAEIVFDGNFSGVCIDAHPAAVGTEEGAVEVVTAVEVDVGVVIGGEVDVVDSEYGPFAGGGRDELIDGKRTLERHKNGVLFFVGVLFDFVDEVGDVPVGSGDAENEIERDGGDADCLVQIRTKDAQAFAEAETEEVFPEGAVYPNSGYAEGDEPEGEEGGDCHADVIGEEFVVEIHKPALEGVLIAEWLAGDLAGVLVDAELMPVVGSERLHVGNVARFGVAVE